MQGRITLFGKADCSACTIAERELQRLGAPIAKKMCGPENKAALCRLIGVPETARLKLPLVFFNLHFVGDGEKVLTIIDESDFTALAEHLVRPLWLEGEEQWKKDMFM